MLALCDGRDIGGDALGRRLDGRERTQVIVAVKGEAGAGCQTAHLAIAHIQQAALAQGAPHAGNCRQIQRVIGTLTRQHLAGDRHAQWIERRQQHFELGQIGAVVFAVAELEEASLRHLPVATAGGRIHAHPGRAQVIDAQGGAGEGALEADPGGIIAQEAQDTGEAVIGQVERLERLGQIGLERLQARFSPRTNVIQAVIALGEHMDEPDGSDPGDGQSLPVAMLMEVLVQQAGTSMRVSWVSSSGISSTRSVVIVKVSVMPRAYANHANLSKYERTMS
jgi:hypothetical protein